MDLYKELLIGVLQNSGSVRVSFPQIENIENLTESRCLKILEEIVKIVRDDSLEDKECFCKIEKIVTLLEKNGISCGTRHDFG